MFQAFAEWVTQSMTDCVWSAKWAEECMAAPLSVCQKHVALVEELSFLSSLWCQWSNVFYVYVCVLESEATQYFSVCLEHQAESEETSGILLG